VTAAAVLAVVFCNNNLSSKVATFVAECCGSSVATLEIVSLAAVPLLL